MINPELPEFVDGPPDVYDQLAKPIHFLGELGVKGVILATAAGVVVTGTIDFAHHFIDSIPTALGPVASGVAIIALSAFGVAKLVYEHFNISADPHHESFSEESDYND